MNKSKVVEVFCPNCRMPVIGKVGDHCLCGAALRANVVRIASHPTFTK
jgi:hypothetical protein